jgi:23S rRNA (uracil1939-C5)-methyltransferase
VTGVERSAAAVADAEANARRLGVRDCRFVCATVEAALSGGLGEQLPTAPDVVVLDPPRGGAPRVLGSVLGLGPRRIVYVSCDPPALARDLAVLTREGYRLAVVQPLDLFPNTYHLEAVALLTAA